MSALSFIIYLTTIASSILISVEVYKLKNKYKYEFLNLYLIYIIAFCIYTSITISAKIWFLHFFQQSYFLVVTLIITILVPVHLVSNAYLFLFFQNTVQKKVSKIQLVLLVSYQSIIFILYALAIPQTTLNHSDKTDIIKLAGFLDLLFITTIMIVFLINSLKTKEKAVKSFTAKLSVFFLLSFPVTLGLLEFTNIGFTLFSNPVSGYFFVMIVLFFINIPPVFLIRFHLKHNRFDLDSVYKKKVSSPLALANYNLTNREREIAALVAQGKTNSEIGDLLFISEKTVKNIITATYRKTGVKNRVQLSILFKDNF